MFKQMISNYNLKKYPISVPFPKGLGVASVYQPLNNAKSGVLFMEIWEEVKQKPVYQISNKGRLRRDGRIRKEANLPKDGYPVYSMKSDGKTISIRVHRLMAIAFIPNPDNKPEVNHNPNHQVIHPLFLSIP